MSLCRIKGHVVAPIGLRAGVFRCNMIADSGRGVAVWRLKKSIDANNVTVTCVMLCSSSLESGHGSILLPVLPAVVRCIEMAEGGAGGIGHWTGVCVRAGHNPRLRFSGKCSVTLIYTPSW